MYPGLYIVPYIDILYLENYGRKSLIIIFIACNIFRSSVSGCLYDVQKDQATIHCKDLRYPREISSSRDTGGYRL